MDGAKFAVSFLSLFLPFSLPLFVRTSNLLARLPVTMGGKEREREEIGGRGCGPGQKRGRKEKGEEHPWADTRAVYGENLPKILLC